MALYLSADDVEPRVLICGSRTFKSEWLIKTVLDELLDELGYFVLVHGTAAGADMLANKWSEENDIAMLKYAPDWNINGKAAGPIRNRKMLNTARPDLVLAFLNKPLAQSIGTLDMVTIAEKAEVPVRVFTIY